MADLSGPAVAMSRPSAVPAAGRYDARGFLRRFPPYYLLLAVCLLAASPAIRQAVGWHAAYLSNFYFVRQGAVDGPAAHLWSLAVEEQFYLVWPWLILFLPRRW